MVSFGESVFIMKELNLFITTTFFIQGCLKISFFFFGKGYSGVLNFFVFVLGTRVLFIIIWGDSVGKGFYFEYR